MSLPGTAERLDHFRIVLVGVVGPAWQSHRSLEASNAAWTKPH